MANSYLGTYGDDNNNPYGNNELNPDIFHGVNQIVSNVDGVTKSVKGNIERRIKKLQTRLDHMNLPELAILDNATTTTNSGSNSFGPTTTPSYTSPSDCPRTCRLYYVYMVIRKPTAPQPFGNDFTCLVTELSTGNWEVVCRDVPYSVMKLYLGHYESEWNYPWRCSEPCEGQPPTPPDCPPDQHYENGVCVPNNPPTDDTPDDPDNPNECPTGYHWNGFMCVPDDVTNPPNDDGNSDCCQVINNITTTPPDVVVNCPPPTIVVNTKPDTINVECKPVIVNGEQIKVVLEGLTLNCPPPQITVINNVKCGAGDGEPEKPKEDCETKCSELEGQEKEDCIAQCNEPNWLRFLISKAGQKKMAKYADEMGYPTRLGGGGTIFEDVAAISNSIRSMCTVKSQQTP